MCLCLCVHMGVQVYVQLHVCGSLKSMSDTLLNCCPSDFLESGPFVNLEPVGIEQWPASSKDPPGFPCLVLWLHMVSFSLHSDFFLPFLFLFITCFFFFHFGSGWSRAWHILGKHSTFKCIPIPLIFLYVRKFCSTGWLSGCDGMLWWKRVRENSQSMSN